MSRVGKNKGLRPLGSVRHNGALATKPVHIPKLTNAPEIVTENKIDGKYEGIQGSAMTVPPQEMTPENTDVAKRVKPVTISSAKSLNEVERKANHTKIRDLESKIANLEKIIGELRALLSQRDEQLDTAQEQLTTQELASKVTLELEISRHKETEQILAKTQLNLEETHQQITQLTAEFTHKLEEQRSEFEKHHAEAMAVKEKEITERDTKLERLKHQMADTLKGNSWERQHQLEELTKELGRIQDESDVLRMKLKSFAKHKVNCANCLELSAKLERALVIQSEQENAIKDHRSIIGKLKKQLDLTSKKT